MSDYGRETVSLVEIDQPFCTREYGDAFVSPSGGCTAQLGVDGTRKCYNTRATCQDSANYNPGTLTLRFCRGQSKLQRYYSPLIPSIVDGPDITPLEINLAAMDDAGTDSALGKREAVKIRFEDHQHSDLRVDKYRLQRPTGAAASGSPASDQDTFDPYQRGTFWGKWLARNPYHIGYPLRVYQGFVGDDISDMRVSYYIIDRIDGPTEGLVTLQAKDEFARIEARKALAPIASRGALASDITGTPGSFTVTPSDIVEEDYPNPAGLYIAIGNEIIRCSRSGATFTILQRAALNTTQEDHDQEDAVQWVLVYETELSHDIVYDLLTTYGGVDADRIPLETWDANASSVTRVYTGYIAEPTPVAQLVGELMAQAGFTVWPDVSTNEIRYAAFRAASASPTVDDDGWIVDGSLSTKRAVEKRLSRVQVYYGLINPLEKLDEKRNYHSRLLDPDLEAEGSTQYGTKQLRVLYSRWIPQFGRQSALECSERILAMHRDPPRDAKFSIHASRDGELDLAAFFYLQTPDVQDDTGAQALTVMAPISIERGENEHGIGARSVNVAAEVTDRTIYIENDSERLTLREIHDSLYAELDVSSPSVPVEFIVVEGVTVSSNDTGEPAMRTGIWPAGIPLRLTILGRIQGEGGLGARGGYYNGGTGSPGGKAFLAEVPITVDNTDGQIWSGGGGGGGGAGGRTLAGIDLGGGGGGGGAGNDPGDGGDGGSPPGGENGVHGDAGTSEEGGEGKEGATSFGLNVGRGGDGGGPGDAGLTGSSPGSGMVISGTPGSGGAPGNAVEGNSFITWAGTGDRKGTIA